MNTFDRMNDAIVRRNIAQRSAKESSGPYQRDMCDRAAYWERRAARYARMLGTRLVPLPGTMEDIITAELFLRLTEEEAE